ncbi:MAG: T9SS type A sorting domain-containing protein, partial [Bacteroidales bacterium]
HNRLSWIDNNLPGTCNSVDINEPFGLTGKIHAYPNPTTKKLFVDINTELIQPPHIELINTMGQTINTSTVMSSSGGITTLFIDTESLTSGFWMIRISSGNKVYQGNFIKAE